MAIDEQGSEQVKELPLWQQQMRVRAFRLLGWALPLFLIAFAVSSMIPHVPQSEIMVREWGEAFIIKGRIDVPKLGADEVTAAILLDGPVPSPKAGPIDIRVKTLDGSTDIKKRWNFRPEVQLDRTWKASFPLKLPSGQTVAYRIRTQGAPEWLHGAKLHVIANPSRSVDRYLRFVELLLYPSLSFCLLAVVMILFVKYSRQ